MHLLNAPSLALIGIVAVFQVGAWLIPGPNAAGLAPKKLGHPRCQEVIGQTLQMASEDEGTSPLRVSLKKPLGISLEEISPGVPGVKVAGLVDGGSAKVCGEIVPGMCLIEVFGNDVTGSSFDAIMGTLLAAPETTPIDLAFSAPEKTLAVARVPPAVPCDLEIRSPGGKVTVISARTGDNLRKALLTAKIDVYDMVGKMTNCNGGGQCGTCVVSLDKADGWEERSEWEEGKLKGRPENHRLSCQTLVGGAATVTIRPLKA